MQFCKRCGTDTERYPSGGCKPCIKARSLSRAKANPDALRVYQAAYRSENSERIREGQRLWREAHPDYQKKYSISHHEQLRNYASATSLDRAKTREAYYLANAEKLKTYASKYRKDNPEAYREYQRKRRTLKRATGGPLPKDLTLRLLDQQGGLCACCGLPLGSNFHIDHKVPLSKGGGDVESNVQLLRKVCNLKKGRKLI